MADQKFIEYNKSKIDKFKPYGPPKIKWDAGKGLYESVSKKYFDGYGLSKIFVDYKKITFYDVDTFYKGLELKGDVFQNGKQSIKGGSCYIENQNLSADGWSENAVVASNVHIGNYVFEQNGSEYKTENRRYILVPDEDTKKDIKTKMLKVCGDDEEYFNYTSQLLADKVFRTINNIPLVLEYIRYSNKNLNVGYVRGVPATIRPQKVHGFEEVLNWLSYFCSRKIFESQFNGPTKFYNHGFELSKPNWNITVAPEPGVEIFNEGGLSTADGIYGLRNSFVIAKSNSFGLSYKKPNGPGVTLRAGTETNEDYGSALNDIKNHTIISISSLEIIRYISDIIDACILFLKNDSSVYKEMADKLFPFISEGGDKEEFQKAFFTNFINGFINGGAYTAHRDLRPLLINSEAGNYSTAEIISNILSKVKNNINANVNCIVKTKSEVLIGEVFDQIRGNAFYFSYGYGYFNSPAKSSQIPWPPVENVSDLENLYHTVELHLFFSLRKYTKLCGDVSSSFFIDDSWKYYNNRTFWKFVAEHLIIAEDSKSMAITKTEEKGPDGEKRERTVLNEFDIRKSVRDITNSIWYLDDYNWSMDRKNLNELGMEITDFQKLRIYELQPDRQVSFKRLTESLINAAKSVYNSIGSGVIGQVIKGLTETAVTAVVNEEGSTNIQSQNYATNVDWISELLQGTWVGQYDIPFFGKNFLKADTTSSWAMGNLADSADFLKNDLTTNVQDIPTWAYNPGKAEAISTTIYLLNEDVDSIIKNLKFLHSITAGAWWVQTSFVGYRQPNLYRVLCPGRFIMLYASMAITAEMVGKIRRYSQQDAEEMFGKGAEVNSFMPFKLYTSAGEGNCNIPEAYKLTLKIQDLTPQVFNVMANFFTNGYGNESTKLYPNIFVKQLNTVDLAKVKTEVGNITSQIHMPTS